MNKYSKLEQDLRTAFTAGLKASAAVSDGGTCNFDSAKVYLPRWSESKVESAAKAAGGFASKRVQYGQAVFYLTVGPTGQGFKRTVCAEKIRDVLNQLGYDAAVSYVMD